MRRCRSKQIFGGAKDFCPNFPKLAQKVVVQLLPTVFVVWPPKNDLHLFFCKPWAPFLEVKQRWAPFLLRFSGISPRYLRILFGFSGILPKFSEILPKFSEILPGFSEILPGFSTHQNSWGCACTSCTPASYTTDNMPCPPHFSL